MLCATSSSGTPDGILSRLVPKEKETAMKTADRTAVMVGSDRFSTVTARNAEGKIVWTA